MLLSCYYLFNIYFIVKIYVFVIYKTENSVQKYFTEAEL